MDAPQSHNRPDGNPTVSLPPRPTSTALSSTLLIPGYEILGELGRGGMGVVYKARSLTLQRPCALKMILAGAHSGDTEIERFKTEAQAIARLQHPGIVQVFEIGEHAGLPFIALEFCGGGSLDAVLAKNPLQPHDAAVLLQKLAEAIYVAHQAKVIHRDLKPANVLLTDKNEPKITDFGLAKKLDEQGTTRTGHVMGTPSYMPPEQAQGSKDIGPAADIYALGAILYECLTGRPPFKAATDMDTLLQMLSDDPVPVRQLNHQVPVDLETICGKCLHKDPHKRYQTAQELADDLGRYLNGEPIHARPVGAAERAVKWVKRNTLVSVLGAATFAALAVGLIVSLWQRDVAQRQARRADEKATEAGDNLHIAQEEKKRTQIQLDRAERLVYAGKLALSQQAFQENNGTLALAYLEESQWKLRGWEHSHLWTRFNARQTLRGHTDIVCCVTYRPDGKYIASGSSDQTVKVWDVGTGQEVLSLKGHTNGVLSVAYSPNGKRIASGSSDWSVRVWDAEKGTELRLLKGHEGGVFGLAISPDSKRIASTSDDRTVRVWDVDTGDELHVFTGHTSGVGGIAFSPDGKRLASASWDQSVKIWDLARGQEVITLKGHTGFVVSVAYSPDGKRLVSSSWDKSVKVWDADTGVELLSLKGHTLGVNCVAYSPDGQRIASASTDKKVKVWNAVNGQEINSLTGQTAFVNSLAFSPDGRRIVAAGSDLTLRAWDVYQGQEVLTLLGHTDAVLSLAVSADGKRIASGSVDRTVKTWDADTGKEVLSLKGHMAVVNSVAFSPDGKRIVSGSEDKTVRVWDADSGREFRILKGHTGEVFSVVFNGDGSRIASASADRTVKVWDVASGNELHVLRGHTERVTGVAYSPDGKRMVTVGWDHTVRMWEADIGTELFSLKGLTVCGGSLAFSADGKRIVAGCEGSSLKVWDVATGQELLTLNGHTNGVESVAYSPDGKRIVSASNDQTVRLWDAHTGAELLALKGHPEGVSSVAFSPEGRRILSGGGDKVFQKGDRTVKVWDTGKVQEVVTLWGHTEQVKSVAFSTDGQRVFGWDDAGQCLAWTVPEGKPSEPTAPPVNANETSAFSPNGLHRAFVNFNNVILLDVALHQSQNVWPLSNRTERLRHHREQAERDEQKQQWFAVAFHLGRMLLDDPDNADLKRRRDEALKKHDVVEKPRLMDKVP